MKATEEEPSIPPVTNLSQAVSSVPSGTVPDELMPGADPVMVIRFIELEPIPGSDGLQRTYTLWDPEDPTNISFELRTRILRELSYEELVDILDPFMSIREFSEAHLFESIIDSYLTHRQVILSRETQKVSARFLSGEKVSKMGIGYQPETLIGYLDAGDTMTMECQQCHFLNPGRTRKELEASIRCLVAKG